MKTLLVGINSKFIHTSLSVRCLASYAHSKNISCDFEEFTVNNEPDRITERLFLYKADVYAFSVYIFNIATVKRVAAALKKVLPESVIVCGGPEVSFCSRAFLTENIWADFILTGEGEEPFCDFVSTYDNSLSVAENKARFSERCFRNLSYIYNNVYQDFGYRAVPCSLDGYPFPYETLVGLEERILYYESSRGCPFRCSYCLSSSDIESPLSKVRLRSTDIVKKELMHFISVRVRQVKFTDRTFNCDRDRALEIWKFLVDNDNGCTNYHFEIAAWLLRDEDVSFLKTVRNGLFRFEIGVQSTNPKTLEAIGRAVPFTSMSERISALIHSPVHIHTDLIAGLPFENLDSFARSFNDVMALGSDCLQLGFLKVLKGAPISLQNEHGNVFCDDAPYEIMRNRYLSYGDILVLKRIERVLDSFYNSGLCSFMNAECINSVFAVDCFTFYSEFSSYLDNIGYFDAKHKPVDSITDLYEFYKTKVSENAAEYMAAFDYYRIWRSGYTPYWLSSLPEKNRLSEALSDTALIKSHLDPCEQAIFNKYDINHWYRCCAVVRFEYDESGMKNGRDVLFITGELSKYIIIT